MSEDFDSQIAAVEKELEGAVNDLATYRQYFVNAATELIQDFYMKETESRVKRMTSVTECIPKERLSALKAAVRELQDAAPGEVSKLMSDEKLWWSAERDTFDSINAFHSFDGFSGVLKRATLPLLPVLRDFGYFSDGESHHTDALSRGGRPLHATELIPFYPGYSDQLRGIEKQYTEGVNRCMQLKQKIASLKHEKSQSLAKDKWDQA